MTIKDGKIDLSLFNYYSPEGESVSTQRFQTYSSQYFVRNSDGSVTFIAPSYGSNIKHTANSTYARSETRSTFANGDDKEQDWAIQSSPLHILYQDFSVDELAKSGKAIVGQIHGKTNHPMLKRQITDNKIYLQLRSKLDGSEDKIVIVDNYKLGTRIQLEGWLYADGRYKEFKNVGNGWEQVVNGKLTKEGYLFDVNSYKNDRQYTKYGMYSQQLISTTDKSVGQGVATYWDFGITHFDSIPQYEPGQEPVVVIPPVEPPVLDQYEEVQKRIDTLQSGYYTSLKLLQSSIKTELNILTTDMKALTDKQKTGPMYVEIKAFKADLENGLIRTTE